MAQHQILRIPAAVVFDVENAEHRQFFHNFRKNLTWKGAPRFVLEDQWSNVPDMITNKMLDYYMKGEFGTK